MDNSNSEENTISLNEYLNNINKEILYITKFKKSEEIKNCTYNGSYITQEIYVCVTCFNENIKLAGLCHGCAFKCHSDHDVVNLGFKRNFLCDCGNTKFCIKK